MPRSLDDILGPAPGTATTVEVPFAASGNRRSVDDILGPELKEVSAIAGAAPEQYTGLTRAVALPSQAIWDAVPAVLGFPGVVNQLFNQYVTKPVSGQEGVQIFPTPAYIRQGTDYLGLTGNPRMIPGKGEYPKTEKMISSGITGTATGLALAPIGGGIPVAAASGLAGGVVGEAAHELFPDSEIAPILGGLAGGFAGGGVVGAGERWLANAAARTKAAEATEKAGIAKGVVETGKLEKAGILRDVKAGARGQADTVATQADQEIENVAALHGTATTAQEAGKELQKWARQWIVDTFHGTPATATSPAIPSRMSKVWQPLDSAIPADTTGAINNLYGAAKKITENAGTLGEAESLFRSKLPESLKGKLDGILDMGDTVTWQNLSRFRTTLGDAKGNSQIVNSVGEKNLNRLYAAVTADMEEVASKAGAGDLFKQVNAESNRLYEVAEGPMSKIVSGHKVSGADPHPEKIAKSLDATDLAVLRREIPQGVNQVAAHNLRGGKAWEKMTPEEQAALVPDPAHRVLLDTAIGDREAAKVAAKKEIEYLTGALGDVQSRNAFAANKMKEEAESLQLALKGKGATEQQMHNHLIRFFGSEIAGGALGKLSGAGHLIPGVDPVWGEVLGTLGGMMIPPIARGAMKTPMAGPIGAFGAEANPLLPAIDFSWGQKPKP